MRFKKLRLSVGIALILFIFIVGNIIIFGKLVDKKPIAKSNNSDQNAVLIDPKQMESKNIPTETKTTLASQESRVVHHNIRTRAS